jgi:hypothetical protein
MITLVTVILSSGDTLFGDSLFSDCRKETERQNATKNETRIIDGETAGTMMETFVIG